MLTSQMEVIKAHNVFTTNSQLKSQNVQKYEIKVCNFFRFLVCYFTALKGCRSIVFTPCVLMGGLVVGKSLSELYLRNHEV